MSDYTNPLTNLSYVNKDFQTIYPELLTLVRDLTSRWDPTISNESDPGVVLLKLNAIIGDKVNYNIDKNVLETMPLSVTQMKNARSLFEQLGYSMHWYRGGEVDIEFRYSGDPYSEDAIAIVPRFTLLSDIDNAVVYTTLVDAPVSLAGKKNATVRAQAGKLVDYVINDSPVIRFSDLDSNRRLYIPDYAVTENGIFIANYDTVNGELISRENYDSWKRVDNLDTQPLGQYVYKFGVDVITGYCYIEFPDDISSLMNQGIQIKYLLSQGTLDNVGINTIEKFLNDALSASIQGTDEKIALDSDNILISNITGTSSCYEPETINSGYHNYRKTVGVFDTLVTLRDYMNAVYNSNLVSNAQVCDRTNDVQNSYKILTAETGVNAQKTIVERSLPIAGSVADKVTLYDSDAFLQHKSSFLTDPVTFTYTSGVWKLGTTTITDFTAYGIAFDPAYTPVNSDYFNVSLSTGSPSLTAFDLKLYLLQPQFNPQTAEEFINSFSMFSNLSADENVVAYLNGSNRCIQHDFSDLRSNKITMIKNAYVVDCKILLQSKISDIQAEDVKNNIRKAIYSRLNARAIDFGEEVSFNDVYTVITEADTRIKTVSLYDLKFYAYASYYDYLAKEWKDICISDETDYVEGYYYNSDFYYDYNHQMIVSPDITKQYLDRTTQKIYSRDVSGYTLYSDLRARFRLEVYAKSVLAGSTQLLLPDTQFKYALYQQGDDLWRDVAHITTACDIIIPVQATPNTEGVQLHKNEVVQFYHSNLIPDTSYSNYVKYSYYNTQDSSKQLVAGVYSELTADDQLVFYWRDDDSSAVYNYAKYPAANNNYVVYPSFTITQDAAIGQLASGLPAGLGTLANNPALNSAIQGYTAGVTSSTKTVDVKTTNAVVLSNPYSYCYFITNRVVDGRFVLFTENETERILQPDEYFIYTNSARTELNILGSGTKITRADTSTASWSCERYEYSRITAEGLNANIPWFEVTSDDNVTITEMEFVNVLPEGYITTADTSSDPAVYVISKDGVHKRVITLIDADENDYSDAIVDFTYLGKAATELEVEYSAVSQGGDPIWHLSDSTETFTWSSIGVDVSIIGTVDIGTVITVTSADEELTAFPSFRYKNPSDTEFIDLSTGTGSSAEWQCRSILNIAVDNTTPQKLYSNDYMILYGYGDDTTPLVELSGTGQTDDTAYNVLSSVQINVDGGDAIDLSMMIAGSNAYVYPVFYSFKKAVMNPVSSPQHTSGFRIDNNGDILYQYLPSVVSGTIQFSLPAGNYIIPIENRNEALGSLTFTLNGSQLHAINSAATQFGTPGKYYIQLDIAAEDNSVNTLSVNTYSSYWSGSITIHPLFKYVKDNLPPQLNYSVTGQFTQGATTKTLTVTDYAKWNAKTQGAPEVTLVYSNTYFWTMGGQIVNLPDCGIDATPLVGVTVTPGATIVFTQTTGYDELLQEIRLFDPDNLYDYTYVVPEAENIENPLDAKSFLELAHPYNPFTMCVAKVINPVIVNK